MTQRSIKVCLTGGGTAGHVMPHVALLPGLQALGWLPVYIGSSGLESKIIKPLGIPFYTISVGKLRRYLTLENLFDVIKVGIGTLQALKILFQERPNVVFSKGGYVSVPVCFAASLLGIPVVTHESDFSPGLANRIISRVANRILYTFPDSGKFLDSRKSRLAGLPVRQSLFEGDRIKGLKLCGFEPDDEMPVLLVMGGSQGAKGINDALEKALPTLVERFRVVHLTGQGKSLSYSHARYKGFEYLADGYTDVLTAADLVLCRAGANSIFEVLCLKKPMLLVPLVQGSRGDQVENALLFQKFGWAKVLEERNITVDHLVASVNELLADAESITAKQGAYEGKGAVAIVMQTLQEVARSKK